MKQPSRARRFLLGSALGVSLLAGAADAVDMTLQHRMKPDDVYELSLRVSTDTEAFSKGAAGENFEETVKLHYQAAVTVLEVDAEGRPVRERHDDASLTYERPDGAGSLFKEGVTLDVERLAGVEISLAGRRLERKMEKVIADVLEKQFEFTLEPALVEPGRPVEVGDTWTPNEDLARRFLRSRGVRVIEFGEEPIARLIRETREDGTSALVIDYRIPISRFELTRMPPNVEPARSEAQLEGRIELAPAPGQAPVATRSHLALALNGLSHTTAQSMPWTVKSTVTVEKRCSLRQSVALLAPAADPLR